MNASIFNTRTSSGYKFMLVLHVGPGLDECTDELFFDTKAEAKAHAKSVSATPYNY